MDAAGENIVSIGKEFSSYVHLTSAIKEYEASNSVTLYTRSSRSIQAARKRAPNRHFSDNLVYSEIDYACVHGGREYKSHSKGIRKSQRLVGILCARDLSVFRHSTFLKDCPFSIKIRASQDGKKLCVKEVSSDHTHELSKVSHVHVCLWF